MAQRTGNDQSRERKRAVSSKGITLDLKSLTTNLSRAALAPALRGLTMESPSPSNQIICDHAPNEKATEQGTSVSFEIEDGSDNA